MFRKKSLSVSIPEPCKEDLNAMTSTDRGRFCGSCQKEVVDFTKMSDAELLAFVSKNGYKVCGTFAVSQLGRKITAPKKIYLQRYRKLAASILAILSFKFSQGQQITKTKVATTLSPVATSTDNSSGSTVPAEYTISGKIETGSSVLLMIDTVRIMVGNNEYSTQADSAGNFKFTLDPVKLKEYTIVSFTHPLMRKEVRSIHRSNFPLVMNVHMTPNVDVLSGVPMYDENGNIVK